MADGFDEVRLPEDIERGSQGGPMFKTTIMDLSSGFEKRNSDWSEQRCSYDVGYGIMTKDDFSLVLKFFYARKGRARGFRFKDWSDFEMPKQDIGTGNNVLQDFQLFKTYEDDAASYDRAIRKPVNGTVKVYKNDVLQTTGYTVAYDTGIVHFNTPVVLGVVVSAECEFDVPVRFDSDKMEVNVQTFEAGSIPQIPIIELKIRS
jgi:uncharacterized protein (TIGR02217 family)